MVKNSLMRKKQLYIKEELRIKNNCFNCVFFKTGKCIWWSIYKKQEEKKIPVNILNNGCKFWVVNSDPFQLLLQEIILKFNGELIE